MARHRRVRWVWWVVGLLVLASVSLRAGCRPSIRVATFNIRMFPEPKTDLDRVAETFAELDADIVGVQEITSLPHLERVLQRASAGTDRRYRALLSRCRDAKYDLTTGLVYDAARLRLVERRDYPELRSDRPESCGRWQPGLLGVFADEDDRRIAVLSLHLPPFPRNWELRREHWQRLVALHRSITAELGIPVVAVGDYNSTGFSGSPEDEPAFVDGIVKAAGLRLLSRDIACTEYYRPNDRGDYLPSILDHIVVGDGDWSEARAIGLCRRLECRPTDPADMDPDFERVSDHCPVYVDGRLD
jgi:endonuclease/exonuclease/phosphatase family metal-dependent hydrolase